MLKNLRVMKILVTEKQNWSSIIRRKNKVVSCFKGRTVKTSRDKKYLVDESFLQLGRNLHLDQESNERMEVNYHKHRLQSKNEVSSRHHLHDQKQNKVRLRKVNLLVELQMITI